MNKIYLFSGIGCAETVFSRLVSPRGYVFRYVKWVEPLRGETVREYVHRMCGDVDMDETDVLLGVSLGGVAVQMLGEVYPQVKKTVIISAPVAKSEFSTLMKIFRACRAEKTVPSAVFTSPYTYSYAVMGSLKRHHRDLVGKFMGGYSAAYYRMAAGMVLRMEEKTPSAERMVRIHGEKDALFPVSKLTTGAYIIKGASHLAVYTHAREINEILKKELLPEL